MLGHELWAGALRPSSDEVRARERLFALVDHSGCDDLLARLSQASSPAWINLFQGTREANADTVAPILIDLGPPGSIDATATRLLNWLTDRCRISNALLLIRSSWTHRALADALRRRLDAELPDAMAVMLRYFDTRVFVSLTEIFDVDQRTLFLGVAREWWWMDRAGQPHHIDSTECGSDDLSVPVQFNERQQAQLIDAAMADAVALEVTRHANDLRSAMNNAELHDFIARCLPATHRYNVENFTMQVIFCITALQHGLEFHQQPQWFDALNEAKAKKFDFAWVARKALGAGA